MARRATRPVAIRWFTTSSKQPEGGGQSKKFREVQKSNYSASFGSSNMVGRRHFILTHRFFTHDRKAKQTPTLHTPSVETCEYPCLITSSLLHFSIHEKSMNTNKSPPSHTQVLATTIQWLERAVIGLNLCPFAKAVHVKKQIRYVVSVAQTPEDLLKDLFSELSFLAQTPAKEIDTTLLIHPGVLGDFADYNDFLDVADAALEELDLVSDIQIASFHPGYQFAGTGPDDIDNYTNRSPYPMLHLLREASVTRAVDAKPDAALIFDQNIAKLRELGHAGWKKLGLPTSSQ